jgi:hypothetical protein
MRRSSKSTLLVSASTLVWALHCATSVEPGEGIDTIQPGAGGSTATGDGDGDGDGDTTSPGGSTSVPDPGDGDGDGDGDAGGSGGMSGTGGGGMAAMAGSAGMAGNMSQAMCEDAPECDDENDCTDDDCVSGVCENENNTDPCEDDADDCTDDVCGGGACTHPDNGTCECELDGDCDQSNICTDVTCVERQCVVANNTDPCGIDLDPCTTDICAEGECTHPDSDVCTAATIVIRANRGGLYVRLNTDYLEHTAGSAFEAELFEKVDETGDQFKLQALSTGNFVRLDVEDELIADTDAAGAMVFEAALCLDPYVGLEATTDDDGDKFVASEGPRLKARSGTCGGASTTSWEKFELEPPN